MKDKKKLFIIIGVAVLLLALIITCVLLKKKPAKAEEIIITFNVDGGEITENIKLKNGKEDTTINADTETTIQNVKAKKGTEITLPKAIKDGFNFMGWYIGEDKQGDKVTLDKDTIITAKWEQIPEDAKTFTVTFNSNGGTSVDKLTVECDKELTLPANPKKEGYTFLSWVDQNETPIYDKALLTCEDITLYANWEKEEKKEEKQKTITYSCTEGDIDDNHKCTKTVDAKYKCPNNTVEYNGKCITLTAQAQNSDQVNRVCGKTTVVVDNNGHTQEVQGVVKYAGYYYCAYSEVSESQSTCTSHGYKWIDNKCYRATTGPGEKITYSCKSDAYTYLTTEQVNSLRQNANINGCFPITSKVPYCENSSYTLNGTKCKKVLGDAIMKEQ